MLMLKGIVRFIWLCSFFTVFLWIGSVQAIDTSKSFCAEAAAPDLESAFWKGCPPDVREALESIYADILGAMTVLPESIQDVPSPIPGEEYFKRWKQGDSHAGILVEKVGFREATKTLSTGRVSSVLMPPDTIEAFFTTVTASIQSLPGPHLLPSIAFVRKGHANTSLSEFKKLGDIIYITPGVDPWPGSDEWVLAEGRRVQIKHGVWRESMAKLRMPFGLLMFHHDLGHITELFEPGMMSAAIAYYTITIANADEKLRADVDKGRINFRDHASFHYARLAALAEDFSLPRLHASALIKSTLGVDLMPNLAVLPTVEDLAQNLTKQLPTSVLLKTAGYIVRNQNNLFLRVGGGTRDINNLPEHLGSASLISQKIGNRLAERRHLVAEPVNNGIVKTLLHESLFGIAKELEFLIRCRAKPDSSNCSVLTSWNTNATEQISLAIARIYLAAESAARLGLTPAIAFAAGSEVDRKPDNILRKYFDAFAGKYSLLHFIFVENPIENPVVP